jgi:hypothetical protein
MTIHDRNWMLRAALALPLVLAAACGGPAEDDEFTAGAYVHALPYREPGSIGNPGALTNAAGPHLHYYGGPIIHSVHVIKVAYGSGTYQSFINGTGTASMAGFYTGVTNSVYFDWLKEYDTTSPAQTITRGSYGGSVTIAPAASRDGSTITDASIQAELNAQIAAGHLPAPNNNTLYMVDFPKGKKISQGGALSCQAGGFCAYHGTFKRGSQDVFYGVLPDMSAGSGCDVGCGSGTAFANQTSVASHEMIEAVTDAAVGLATTFGPPLAWYDSANGEIGDICNAQHATVTGGNGATYTVQKEWSNSRNRCVSQ